jgi:hypothetical protein
MTHDTKDGNKENQMSNTVKSLDKKTKRISSDVDHPQMLNGRKEWVPAIPLPFYGLKKRCSCGKSFWKYDNYLAHYALHHIVLGDLPL